MYDRTAFTNPRDEVHERDEVGAVGTLWAGLDDGRWVEAGGPSFCRGPFSTVGVVAGGNEEGKTVGSGGAILRGDAWGVTGWTLEGRGALSDGTTSVEVGLGGVIVRCCISSSCTSDSFSIILANSLGGVAYKVSARETARSRCSCSELGLVVRSIATACSKSGRPALYMIRPIPYTTSPTWKGDCTWLTV